MKGPREPSPERQSRAKAGQGILPWKELNELKSKLLKGGVIQGTTTGDTFSTGDYDMQGILIQGTTTGDMKGDTRS